MKDTSSSLAAAPHLAQFSPALTRPIPDGFRPIRGRPILAAAGFILVIPAGT